MAGSGLRKLLLPTKIGANLDSAYLQGSTGLRTAYLEETSLRGAHLWGADLRGADLRRANLGGTDLRYADLRRANFDSAHLEKANLREVAILTEPVENNCALVETIYKITDRL